MSAVMYELIISQSDPQSSTRGPSGKDFKHDGTQLINISKHEELLWYFDSRKAANYFISPTLMFLR